MSMSLRNKLCKNVFSSFLIVLLFLQWRPSSCLTKRNESTTGVREFSGNRRNRGNPVASRCTSCHDLFKFSANLTMLANCQWSQTYYQSLTIEDLADFPIWYGKYMTNAWSKGSKAFLIAMHQRHVGSVSSRWMSTAASKAMQPNGRCYLKDLCHCGPCLLAIAGCLWSFWISGNIVSIFSICLLNVVKSELLRSLEIAWLIFNFCLFSIVLDIL